MANSLVPAVNVVIVNDASEILLIRRTEDRGNLLRPQARDPLRQQRRGTAGVLYRHHRPGGQRKANTEQRVKRGPLGPEAEFPGYTMAEKTEAAFLPICSCLAADPPPGPGVPVLCVAPLKALINDQYQRLADLCERLDIPVHRWHGDVPASRKSAVLKKPGGILLITP